MGILDNLTKNPSFLLLAGVGVALFVFRDKISDFFSTITGGVEAAATAGEISQGLLTNLQGNLTGVTTTLNSLTESFENFEFPAFEFPDFTNLFNQQQDTTPPQLDLSEIEREAARQALEINRLRSQLENDLFNIPASEDISGAEFASARNANEFRDRQQAALNAALGNQNFNVQTDIEGNQFRGGGQSFIGGSVREIPVERLSLGGDYRSI